MASIHERNKQLIQPLRDALYNIDPERLQSQLRKVFSPEAEIHLAFPFEDLDGPDGLFEQAYRPLLDAIPDLERRDFIVMAGETQGYNWVGCGGHYMGVFERHWLDIPPTQHAVFMRYHEFFRFEDNIVVEMQALWDIPQVMMQAHAWPLSPALGVEWLVPGPATNDGIITGTYDDEKAKASAKLVTDMLMSLKRSPEGLAAMELDRYWHPRMNWYGPAGIGSMRRIAGFRNWHQIPFLKAMPDRNAFIAKGMLFGDAEYVGFTAWPGGISTVTSDGWLGIAPAGQQIYRRSLDFWRCENGLIRENWVLVDLLYMYDQLGVDVFSRMRELTHARQPR
ncbi:MAG: polyketide cyclase [Chloroflexota bacterium]